jgi:glyoxylase-like metal-dependent hydrolase (beta-lactamase superfamily II)
MDVMVLGAGLDCIDLNFLDTPEVIASVLLHGPGGAALIDPGPTTTLPTLRDGLRTRGLSLSDVRAILLTHIHLDHAGATGTLLRECPHATVYVHERGAPHMADPSRLVASATRLYGPDMDRLWGEMQPVPEDRLHVLTTAAQAAHPARLTIVGHDVEWAYTPGHASHHVSYFLPASRLAFVGDTAGICRPHGRVVLPATPPPDIDLEAWRVSTDRILAWHPDQIVLTHFGPQAAPRVHFADLWQRMDDWSRRARASLDRDGTDETRANDFTREVRAELTRSTTREDAVAYDRAGQFQYSWAGLARYWRKRLSV